MNPQRASHLNHIYQRLFDAFGPQHWWPGDTPFEIMVGAILTQNTNWGNVEKAIDNLKEQKCLTPQAICKMSCSRLANLIKPSGFFNVKAKRLKNFIAFLFKRYDGKISLMAQEDTLILREQLLQVNGIGPETADSILLYALSKPIFVVDAYTKRIFSRHKVIQKEDSYHSVQAIFMKGLKNDRKLFNEYHALIVKLAKEFCKTTPQCEGCPLVSLL